MAGHSKFGRCCAVAIEVFPKMMQELLERYGLPASTIYNMASNATFQTQLSPAEHTALFTLLSDGFLKINVNLAYKLGKHFGFIKSPTDGWGSDPKNSSTNIGDDVERIIRARNNLVHSIEREYSDDEMTVFFQTFLRVGERFDEHLGKPLDSGFKQMIHNYQYCPFDDAVKNKYTDAIQRLEELENSNEATQDVLLSQKTKEVKCDGFVKNVLQKQNRNEMIGNRESRGEFSPDLHDSHGVSHITDGDKTKSTDLDTKHDVTLSAKSVKKVSQKQKRNKKLHSRDTSAKIKPHFHDDDITKECEDEEESESEIDEMERDSDQEKLNYLRIVKLVFLIAASAVRDKLHKECIERGGLQNLLKHGKETIIRPLLKRGEINQHQWDLLFPRKGYALPGLFDLSLMVTLLRCLIKIPIKPTIPHHTEKTIAGDLSIIMYYKKCVTDCESEMLSDQFFLECVSDITEVAVRLSGKKYYKDCINVKDDDVLDHDLQDLLLTIRERRHRGKKRSDSVSVEDGINLTESSTVPVRETLTEGYDLYIDEDKVIETEVMKRLGTLIENENVVTVIGPAGSGRSTAIVYVALQLQRLDGYNIIQFFRPKDIIKYFKSKTYVKGKVIFVGLDIYGTCCLDCNVLYAWERESNYISELIESHDVQEVKILTSCRSNIFHDGKFESISIISKCLFDVLSSDVRLSINERKSMLKKYLSNPDVSSVISLNGLDKFDFFPFLCAIYSKLGTSNVELFSKPVETIKSNLLDETILKRHQIFGTLFLFLIYDNMVVEDVLTGTSKIDYYLQKITDMCKLEPQLSVDVVKLHLDKLTNSYIRKTGNQYTLMHDKMFDILVSFYGEQMYDLVVDLSHSNVVRDRFQFESLENKSDELFINVPIEKETAYFDRLLRDYKISVLKGNVFRNRQLQNISFRAKFMEYFDKKKIFFDGHQLLAVIKQGFYDMVEFLLKRMKKVNVRDAYGCTPLYLAVFNCNIDAVKHLLGHNADPCISDHKKVTPLHVAAATGYGSICKLLLEDTKCNLNSVDIKNQTPLFIASKHGRIEVVSLLLEYECDMKISNKDGQSPLFIAADYGHTEVVKVFLDHHSDPNICDKDGQTPLFTAVKKGQLDTVKLLLEHCNSSDPDLVNKDNETPLAIAVFRGHYPIVKMLLEHSCKINTVDQNSQTPLFIGSRFGHTECVRLLLEYNCDFDIRDNYGRTPLHISAQNGHVDVVKLLLERNCEANVKDKQRKTPIYIASEKGQVETVKLLVSYGCDYNISDDHDITPLEVAVRNGHAEIKSILASVTLSKMTQEN